MPSPNRSVLLKRWLGTIGRPRTMDNPKSPIEPALNEIIEIIQDQLYLGGCNAATAERMSCLGITAVVGVTTKREEHHSFPANVKSLRIMAPDTESVHIGTHFDGVGQFIDTELQSGGKVLVQSVTGVSRSATLVLAYLIKYRNHTLRSAFELVREKRKGIRPNNGFFRQLIQYERELRKDGRCSVRMVVAPSGYAVPDILFERAIMRKLNVITKHSDDAGKCGSKMVNGK